MKNLKLVCGIVPVKIKLVTNWKVSISQRCLNKLAKILKISTKITSKHGEYEQLMNFLTTSGINFLQFIDISDSKFKESIDHIYKDTNTSEFKIVLEKLKKYFSKNCMSRWAKRNKICNNKLKRRYIREYLW